ncbi:MAG: type IV toxin-antitoxin system AbiEi family antitoxin domain-containing protein [Spirochaetales bacterium]|jgi:hypothetical protein
MKLQRGEIDYLTLMDGLKEYAYPRDKVTKLLRAGALLRIKKGLYLWNDLEEPYSRELLANLIYGPSYISLEYALSFHGLIPEAVRAVTSVTTGKNKEFDTPAGSFSYRHLPVKYYSPGIDYEDGAPGKEFMIASPAKAIFDMLYLNAPELRENEAREYFFDDLRMEADVVGDMDFSGIRFLVDSCAKSSIRALGRYLKERGNV